MKENMIYLTSASDCTLVINCPTFNFARTWTARGQKYPIDRDLLEQLYYDASVAYLIKNGMLVTDDKTFMIDVGLMQEDGTCEIENISEDLLKRLISFMPVSEVKTHLAKMSDPQLEELGNYAVEHYKELKMDRVDLLSKATHKNILKAIENYKASQEA